ncbi:MULTISPECIES: energy transducer TonB [unclassified Kaistella]|uniref:energy transducer TonB n=1 Tax=unclassified Kaistella TaxID=2762626 RepID=UPI002734C9A3|nr:MULTISPECIES: energy transducer TonB [unclassified Kaistella]MDP2454867.1 energy transducer TonB [Kaistella sp. SH11-4b]MDP2457604.1 energy transducer TonB [Kaistella sp. SH40-3]MDP2460364.1 energy transducer TonB [Kaistella sp. SH19-2b]
MKNLLQNKEFQLDEILFENRNKNYGAYVLRNEADRILTKSMFIGIGIFAMIAMTPLLMNVFNTQEKTNVPESLPPIDLKNVDQIEKPPIVVQTTPPVQAPVNTLDSTVPTPTKNPEKEKVMPKQSDYDHAIAGTKDIVGEPPVINYTPPAVQDVPVKGPETVTPKPVDNSPRTTVDVEASFIGGINVFRNKVLNQFDSSVMDATGNVIKTTVIFIVEKDGTISEVKATGPNADFNREAIKTIKGVKGKWVPAKLNGENVRSYFKFPISMQFE